MTERSFVQHKCPFVYSEPRQRNRLLKNPSLADRRYPRVSLGVDKVVCSL